MDTRFLDHLLAVHAAKDFASLADAGLRLFDQVFPGCLISFDLIETATGRYEARLNRTIPGFTEVMAAVGRCVARDNPIVELVKKEPPERPGTIYRLSDYIAEEAFAQTELYAVGFRPFGVRFQLAVSVRRGSEFIAMGIKRVRDFTDDECELAGKLAAHLRLAMEHIQTRNLAFAALVPASRLTPREREVWTWLREGKRNADIALLLGCSVSTVKRHCENIYDKLGVSNRTAACHIARP